MTIEINEKRITSNLDGIKKIADAKESSKSGSSHYRQLYSDYLRAYSDIGLYITIIDGKHVIVKSDEL